MNPTGIKRNRLKALPLILIISLILLFTGCQKKPAAPQQPDTSITAATEQATAATEQATEATEQATTAAIEQATEATTLISLPSEEPDSTDSGAASQDISNEASTAETSDAADSASSAESQQATSTDSASSAESQQEIATDPANSAASQQAIATDLASSVASQQTTAAAPASTAPAIAEDGTYTTKDDVALYIHTYGKLPQNFITKKAAKKLGWQGGSLEDYAPGKCIGGDYFGNYEGLLPEDKEYHECDIGTLGKSKRGAKRIIYSDDGYIYYTGDHYKSFELLYEP